MSAATAIAKKDLRLLARDPAAIFWAVVFPTAFAALFGAVLGRTVPPRPIVALADRANDAGSHALVDGLRRAGCDVRMFDEAGAMSEVRRARAAAAVIVPAAAEGQTIAIAVDPARPLEGSVVRADVERAVFGRGAELRELVVTGSLGAPSGHEAALPAAILWGLIGCAGTFAVAIVGERSSGTHLRLLAAPIGRSALVVGKALACFCACAVDAGALLLLGHLGFGVRIGSLPSLIAAIAASALCFTGITMLVGALGKSEQSTGGAGWGALLLLAMLGGAMVPLAAMPSWLQTIGEATPVRWGIAALEGATWRGLAAGELVAPIARLIAVGVACLGVSVLVAERRTA